MLVDDSWELVDLLLLDGSKAERALGRLRFTR
jgi:hypothetical protein